MNRKAREEYAERVALKGKGRRFAPHASETEVLQYGGVFMALDTDESSNLSQDEFAKFVEVSGVQLDMAMFFALDRDHSGGVSLVEILAALFPQAQRLMLLDMVSFIAMTDSKAKDDVEARRSREPTKHELMEYATMFNLYDTDKSGALTVEELVDAMGASGGMEASELHALFDTANLDGDNEISLKEFVGMMTSQA